MWVKLPSLIGNRFDDTTFNMRTGIILVEDHMVLFSWSFRLDCSVKAIKLNQINVTVNVKLPVAIFVRDPSLLALIVVIPITTIAVLDDFPVDDSASVQTYTPYSLLTSVHLLVFLSEKHPLKPKLSFFSRF